METVNIGMVAMSYELVQDIKRIDTSLENITFNIVDERIEGMVTRDV